MNMGGVVGSMLESSREKAELANVTDTLLAELIRLQSTKGYKPNKAIQRAMEKARNLLQGA